MSSQGSNRSSDVEEVAAAIPPHSERITDGLNVRNLLQDSPEQRMDAIEMIGEEVAAQLPPRQPSEITAGMRYLHSSRTIHQLVTDRNRAVGLYLAVATLLWTASTALLNVPETVDIIIPMDVIKKWCLPVTFGIMTVLAWLVAFLLIRTRVGLIYEVAKMNVLLGLPAGRVKRINPLSIFFIMHLIISLAGGITAGMLLVFLFRLAGMELANAAILAALLGTLVTALLIALYIFTVKWTTSIEKLENTSK